jgi:hypothetical protein
MSLVRGSAIPHVQGADQKQGAVSNVSGDSKAAGTFVFLEFSTFSTFVQENLESLLERFWFETV